ncbi:hypothetical protein BY996DRAFT_6527777 [Phakopsora pachyrhizi]|uniref:Uncharacterized protein n=1 Tax=Phakopsora pachyrhizi TaxID=170000 RepID=A0AAV0B0T3_PHAPC|nr:hypothetical protein BY996DRAFT_6527777 [Phakopsora pachyrhizi]CAH7674894.1 hypothetical protein PPACK8108_LOCUS9831 [Phakopsora pachyrhizi]
MRAGKRRGGVWRFLLYPAGFEEEGVVVEEKEQKLGGGAHQGQSGWSETTEATDL